VLFFLPVAIYTGMENFPAIIRQRINVANYTHYKGNKGKVVPVLN
jgi:hypothetical protein